MIKNITSAIFFFACIYYISCQASQTPFTVTRVYDGDTITVRHDNGTTFRVRFICVDAPELNQLPWGPTAQQRAAALLPVGSRVFLLNSTSIDMYGRILTEVSNHQQINVNHLLTREGLTVHYPFQSGCSHFIPSETFARQNNLNVWSDRNFTLPWTFRSSNSNSGK